MVMCDFLVLTREGWLVTNHILHSQPDANRFDRDWLFDVVSRGVPEDLAGLPEYLRKTSKYLTDSDYTEGSTGKTCLMKAVLNLKDGVNACILPLLQIDQDSGNPQPLVSAQCKDDYYRGHSALHIAIEKRSLQCVKLLVENGADVHARACGRFFQKGQGTCFYFGELPLSLAACTKQWDVVSYLLENPHQPASLQATDSQGNTVLHALVMISDNSAENIALVTSMYDGLLQAGARLCPTVQLEDIPNLQGLTPLKLAAKEGKIQEAVGLTPNFQQKEPGVVFSFFLYFYFYLFFLFLPINESFCIFNT
ncbi:Transient receptor putative cation channel sub V member 2 [Saguinus oedipus]|uniref:Transient receptor putative cation channel sub V member 2 n=1 Tax=Saguinus oedipus TaxID=9490 RepID=A0ABQ9VNW3_SAGOE|nr:Transient receptor putative cation channel sub V member 2 [Saguinus oedipus]